MAANPGMEAVPLDITDPRSIAEAAGTLLQNHPDLNVLINNANIMLPNNAAGLIDDALLQSTVDTNLVGPIRLTSALIEHLKSRRGVIIYNTSSLAFVPLSLTAVYSATKAALHSHVTGPIYEPPRAMVSSRLTPQLLYDLTSVLSFCA